jgi:5'-nucleotidase
MFAGMRSLRALLVVLLAVWLLAPVQAQQPRPYRILVTNDDGVRAPGLAALAQILQAIGEVLVVGPIDNQTGKSQSVNTLEPIFREDLTLPNGLQAVGLTATPATAVQVAIKNVLLPPPDLVVSGINNGYNVGTSVYLSGTVGAARQAAMDGVPAIAASIAAAGEPRDLVAAAEEVLGVARRVKQNGLPPFTFLNVNAPAPPAGGYRGYQVTTLASVRAGVETFAEAKHPSGRTIYWSVYREGATAPSGTDVWAVANGFVSVTPMHVGEYDATLAARLRDWFN